MNHLYITNIHIDKVRHLQNIDIPVGSVENRKHLILTGRNGSGKTSLLEAVKGYLNSVSTTNDPYAERVWKQIKVIWHTLSRIMKPKMKLPILKNG